MCVNTFVQQGWCRRTDGGFPQYGQWSEVKRGNTCEICNSLIAIVEGNNLQQHYNANQDEFVRAIQRILFERVITDPEFTRILAAIDDATVSDAYKSNLRNAVRETWPLEPKEHPR